MRVIFSKRAFDFIVSLISLIILLPFFIIIAILIKIDSEGPVFFKQKRLGKNGEVFKIYKFRTMVKNAENKGDGIHIGKNDPRVTKIGKMLRNRSLDELPQMINILKGEMSLVGPRPPVPDFPYKYEKYGEKQKIRFKIKPGLTGWAQVNGRGVLSWQEKFKYDIYYVKNRSLLFDLKIILKTFKIVLLKVGIYKDEER